MMTNIGGKRGGRVWRTEFYTPLWQEKVGGGEELEDQVSCNKDDQNLRERWWQIYIFLYSIIPIQQIQELSFYNPTGSSTIIKLW